MIARLLKRLKPKARSVIITVIGDSIMHHGGCAALGSMIALCAPLGLNERLVRTSVFRLAKENWLVAERIGRRSYCRVTDEGRRRIEAAHGRIYHRTGQPWDRHWTFIIVNFAGMPAARSRGLRNDLRWQGFGQLASGVMLHPDPDEAALRTLLVESRAGRRTLAFRSTAESWISAEAQRDLIERAWDMKRLAADYKTFLATFHPVWQRLARAEAPDPQTCFAVRTLLMHAYRRVLLRDPKLPDELLPANWPGTAARILCRDLYKLVQEPAERFLMARLHTAEGPAPAAHPAYYTRFGGLDSAPEA